MKDRKDMNPYLFPASIWKGELLGGLEYQKNQKHGRHFELWKHPEYIHASDAIGRDYIATIINRVAKRAGVEHAHPHKFRRTCATNALKRGMPIEQVSLMLGHCDLKTTQIYLDIDESDLKRAHDKYVV